MDCLDVVRQLWDYLDGELTDDRMEAIRAHLAACRNCYPHYDFERAFLDELGGDCSLPAGANAALLEDGLVRVRGILGGAPDEDDRTPVHHAVEVGDGPAAGRALWNSVGLAIGTATLVMLLTAVICWIVIRTRLPGRWLLDMLASLPMVFPGIVLGLAVMVCFLYVNIGIYGTIWIIFIAYVIRFMPYGMRYNTTSMLQIHKDLEESAAMSGASWSATFRRIVLPLLKPGLLAGWTFIVVVSIRELSSSVLLYSPGSEVLSIVIWELWLNGQYVELSAFGVMMIVALFAIVMLTQLAGRSFGVKGA